MLYLFFKFINKFWKAGWFGSMKDSNELKIDSDGLGLFTANTTVSRKIPMNSGLMFVCRSLLTATNKTCHTGDILYHWLNQNFVYKMVFCDQTGSYNICALWWNWEKFQDFYMTIPAAMETLKLWEFRSFGSNGYTKESKNAALA